MNRTAAVVPAISPEPTAVNNNSLQPKLLILGLDGFRQDCINSNNCPNLDQLLLTGKWSRSVQMNDICLSGPGWSSILTGVYRDKHCVSNNEFNNSAFAQYPDLITRLKQSNSDIVTGSIVNWEPIIQSIFPSNSLNYQYSYPDNDTAVINRSIELLTDSDIDCLFLHLDEIDRCGHLYDYGPTIPEYINAIKQTDRSIGLLLNSIKSRLSYCNENWLILITTDHGGFDKNHYSNHPLNRTVFIILNYPNTNTTSNSNNNNCGEIIPTPLIVDIVPTILTHFNIKIQSNWNLDSSTNSKLFTIY